MTRFRVGDIVRIAKTSRFYRAGGNFRPRDTNGEIVEINVYGGKRIKWDSGETSNFIDDKSLKLRKRG